MVLRGRRCGAPQQPQATATAGLSTVGRKPGQERSENACSQRSPTPRPAGLGCTGQRHPAPWPGMLHAGGWDWLGSPPGLWGCDPNPMFTGTIWDPGIVPRSSKLCSHLMGAARGCPGDSSISFLMRQQAVGVGSHSPGSTFCNWFDFHVRFCPLHRKRQAGAKGR